MSKFILALLFCFTPALMIGCGPGAPTDVTEGAEQSDIDTYKKMVAEEDAANSGADTGTNDLPK